MKFQLKLITLTFRTKYAQKSRFRSKTKKVDTTIEFCIFKLVEISRLTDNFDFLYQIYPKREFPIEKRKNEHHH